MVAKKVFKVEGMGCQHCVDEITRTLKALEGVQEVLVDLQGAKVEVTWEGDLKEAALVQALEGAGYQVE